MQTIRTVSSSNLPPFLLGEPTSGSRGMQGSIYRTGSAIYEQGDRSGSCYHIDFGAVRICRLLSDGRRQVIAFHFAGESFGFEAGEHRNYSAEALVPSKIRSFPQPANEAQAGYMLKLALRSLSRAQDHLLVIGRQSASERIAAFLVDMAARQEDLDHVELPMSRQDIADYLGLTIETISRVFTRLRTDGLIDLPTSRSVILKKRNALARMAA